MEIPKKIENAFNNQINKELSSAYIYLSMAAYFDAENLEGMGAWMKNQAKEEIGHAMKFYKHIIDRDGKVVLEAVEKQTTPWKSPLNAFETAYKHEQFITREIHKLVELAQAEKDKAAESMLQWFVDEQVEEEATTDKIVKRLKLIRDDTAGLLMLDKELGKEKP